MYNFLKKIRRPWNYILVDYIIIKFFIEDVRNEVIEMKKEYYGDKK